MATAQEQEEEGRKMVVAVVEDITEQVVAVITE